jgi:hypothetical protein
MSIESDVIKALQSAKDDYDEDLRHLSPGGRPLYAPDIMAAKTAAIRSTYLAEVARLENKARGAMAAADSKLAAGRRDSYAWLSDDELRRANLLAPFVAEDIARGAPIVATGDRARNWLQWRAAVAAGLPGVDQYEHLAWPDDMLAAAESVTQARAALSAIEQAHPDYEANTLAQFGMVAYAE